jgi:hypothetical protein
MKNGGTLLDSQVVSAAKNGAIASDQTGSYGDSAFLEALPRFFQGSLEARISLHAQAYLMVCQWLLIAASYGEGKHKSSKKASSSLGYHDWKIFPC